MSLYAEMMKTLIAKNSSPFQSKQDFIIEAQQIEDNYNCAAERLSSLECERAERIRKGKEIKGFTAIIKKQPLAITEWDERLWITLLNTATVQCDGSIEFLFKNGTVIKV